MIKVLISSVMLAMLTGCVSPYYPMPDSAYRSYDAAPRAPYRDSHFDASYYPWWSVDYFYLGSHHYRPAYGTTFSFSLSSGYPYYGPYYYPGYYSAWYAPYHYYDPWFGAYYGWGGGYGRYDPYWRHGYGGHAYRSPRHDRSGGHERDPGSYRDDEHVGYSGGSRSRGDYRQGGGHDIRDRPAQAGGRSDQRRTGPVGTNRNVSVAPTRGTTDRGMVIVNRGDGKPRPNRVEPVSRQGVVQAAPPQSPATSPPVRPARSYSTPDRSASRDSDDDDDRRPPDSNPRSGNRNRKDR